jgi:hypothetical protein
VNPLYLHFFLSVSLVSTVSAAADWQLGSPVVTYWCGPALTDATADQLVEGGFNLAWCSEATLDVARRHGLRGMLENGLLNPATLDNADQRRKLDELIDRVRIHPALYAYYITDEPSAAQFPALGRLVAHLRERDPAHLAYINLFPTYANNEQLGNKGDVVTAYREHLKQFIAQVKPALLSYDHYQFGLHEDSKQYFLNLAEVRRAAQAAGLPFLNIVQASSWAPKSVRVPGSNEVRYLVYTTAAYGAQGLSYYIYSCANHLGGIAQADGTPTSLYYAVKDYNREFTALTKELQSMRSLGVWHTAMREPGCEPLPDGAPFKITSTAQTDVSRGFLLGTFGSAGGKPTRVLVVNLDYKGSATATLNAAGRMRLFQPGAGRNSWGSWSKQTVELRLPPGGGVLVQVR